MYVSVTGFKPKGLMGYVLFLIFTIPASTSAQKADGVLLCEFNSRNHLQDTPTVWKLKKQMLTYRSSSSHLRAMKRISKIGTGKVFGCETESIPSWKDALIEWVKNGREFKKEFSSQL